MRVFVPVEDAPAGLSIEMLVPYRCGLSCAHGLDEAAACFGESIDASAPRSLKSPAWDVDSEDGGTN